MTTSAREKPSDKLGKAEEGQRERQEGEGGARGTKKYDDKSWERNQRRIRWRLTTTIIRAPPNLRSSEPHWPADFSISRKKDPRFGTKVLVLAQIKSRMLLHSISSA